MAEKKGLHDGHRDRVREKFLEDGLGKFRDHEALELMLFYAIPRKDTNEIAHKLINRFGSFSGVLDAEVDALTECGISKNAAVFLKLFPSVCARYYKDRYKNDHSQDDDTGIGETIAHYFIGANEEQVVLMLLDPKGRQLYCDIISKGTLTASDVNIKKILQLAVKYKASGAVLAHNHPSGIPLPSDSDVKATIALKNSLRSIGVVLFDHIIVAEMEYVSMADMDEYYELFII